METNEDDFVEIAADATEASARPCGKPGRSGPPGNRNARTGLRRNALRVGVHLGADLSRSPEFVTTGSTAS